MCMSSSGPLKRFAFLRLRPQAGSTVSPGGKKSRMTWNREPGERKSRAGVSQGFGVKSAEAESFWLATWVLDSSLRRLPEAGALLLSPTRYVGASSQPSDQKVLRALQWGVQASGRTGENPGGQAVWLLG